MDIVNLIAPLILFLLFFFFSRRGAKGKKTTETPEEYEKRQRRYRDVLRAMDIEVPEEERPIKRPPPPPAAKKAAKKQARPAAPPAQQEKMLPQLEHLNPEWHHKYQADDTIKQSRGGSLIKRLHSKQEMIILQAIIGPPKSKDEG